MATRGMVRGTAATRRRPSAGQMVRSAIRATRVAWTTRRERAWLGLVAVPLAMTASGLVGMWWTWPLLVAGSWACTPSWRWSWMLALEEAFVSVQWAFVGAVALAQSPSARLLVGALWTAFPVTLVATGEMNRRRRNRPEAYFPLR